VESFSETTQTPPSIEHLLTVHEEQIRRIIVRRSGPAVLRRTTVDDLFQEAAAAAISSAHGFTYQNDARFISWITTIAHRVISHSLRGSKGARPFLSLRRPGSSGTGIGESGLHALISTPSSIAAGNEQRRSLQAAILGLQESHREVLQLYRIDERSLADVADRLGKTKGATCKLIARATESLRKSMGT
jgi:RNA polymerase sigma factor (sigma-70 family)